MLNRKDKIVVVIVISNLEYGGAQRQLIELSNNMDKNRFDVHIVALSSYVPMAMNLINHDCLHIIRKYFKYDFTVVLRLACLLRKLNADIVQSYFFDAEIVARLAGKLIGTPLIISSERNTNYVHKRIHLIAYELTGSIPDICIANSISGAEFNSATLRQSKSMYRVVHNGVDTKNRFKPMVATNIRNEVGLNEKDFVVGMFGSFKEQKNHTMFFRAAKKVMEKYPETRFMLVGDQLYGGVDDSDRYKIRIEKLVDVLGIRSNCHFLGNRQDVELLYNVCDVTVLPSLFEGTPNVALESMACGIPVIATDVSDNCYIIPDGQAGYIINLGDEKALASKIIDLIESKDRLMKFKKNCREWVVSEFSIERLVEETASIYEIELAMKSLVSQR